MNEWSRWLLVIVFVVWVVTCSGTHWNAKTKTYQGTNHFLFFDEWWGEDQNKNKRNFMNCRWMQITSGVRKTANILCGDLNLFFLILQIKRCVVSVSLIDSFCWKIYFHVWVNCGTTLRSKLQKLQNRAVRVLTNSNYDVDAGFYYIRY